MLHVMYWYIWILGEIVGLSITVPYRYGLLPWSDHLLLNIVRSFASEKSLIVKHIHSSSIFYKPYAPAQGSPAALTHPPTII